MKINLSRFGILCLALVLMLITLTACTSPPKETASPVIEVTDQLGRAVKLDKIPQRIISLAPGNTEIIYALGLADKLVAVTDYCDYPPEAKEKPKIGGFSTPNLEEIVNHSPDLILATSIHEDEIIPNLENRGMTVLALDAKTLAEVLTAINLVGKITGQEEKTTSLLADMRDRIKTITDKTETLSQEQKPKVFYIIRGDPLWTAGSGTSIHELIKMAGGVNVFQDLASYSTTSLEAVIEANPEIIIIGKGHGSAESALQYVVTESRLESVEARIRNQVYEINTDLVSRDGPRLVDGLEQIARLIHPGIFGPIE